MPCNSASVSTNAAPLRPEVAAAVAAAPPVTVLRVPRDALADWLAPAVGGALEQHDYIVDPLGRWMMRMPPEPEPASSMAACMASRTTGFWPWPR